MARYTIKSNEFGERMMGASAFSFERENLKETKFTNDPKKYAPKEYPENNTPFGDLKMPDNPVIEIAVKQGLLKGLEGGRALVTAKGTEFLQLYFRDFYTEGSLEDKNMIWFFGRLNSDNGDEADRNGYVMWGKDNGLLEMKNDRLTVKYPEGYKFLNLLKSFSVIFNLDIDNLVFSEATPNGNSVEKRLTNAKKHQRDRFTPKRKF